MLSDAVIDRCRAIATSTWSDAIDATGSGTIAIGLAWRCGRGRAAGRALTVREEVADVGVHAPAEFALGRCLKLGRPGDVLVVDMGGAAVSTFGGLAAKSALAQGFAAAAIDGACRDVEALRASGLAIASRHVTPVSGKGRARIVEINGTVTCGGVRVEAGDLVVLDETGVVFVPVQAVSTVLPVAEKIEEGDRRAQAALDQGASFHDSTALRDR